MTPRDLKEARELLGLTPLQMARVLGIPILRWRRLENGPDFRIRAVITKTELLLLRSYLAGYRPPDWLDTSTEAATIIRPSRAPARAAKIGTAVQGRIRQARGV